MTISSSIRQQERIVNSELARLLRERCNLDAQAEVIIDGRQPDVLVMHPNHGPIIIETEFEPARSVNDDALAKLGLKVYGTPTLVTFAVTLPQELKFIRQQHLFDRVATSMLQWQAWHADATSEQRASGGYQDLCDQIRHVVTRSDDLERAVSVLEGGAQTAAATLHFSPGSVSQIARVFDRDPSDEVINMAALMVINAMVFHDRLSGLSPEIPPSPKNLHTSNLSRDLLNAWIQVLKKDYWPIFRSAYDVLFAMPPDDGHRFASECRSTADVLQTMSSTSRHDLAGQVFNRLVAHRKFLATFYTSVPAATLLAGLALDPRLYPDIDWSDLNSIRDFVVLDPACGTGTLLMSAYHRITQNHRVSRSVSARPSSDALHKTLIENTIHGADVVDAGIHLTASTLAAMAPSVTFEQMNLHVMPLDDDDVDGPRLGSLDWLESDQLKSMFSGAGEQVGALEGLTSTTVQRPKPNLVIANPPYTRHESDSGKGERRTRVFGHKNIAVGTKLSRKLSSMLSSTPASQSTGLASAFFVLADRLLENDGRLAFVLPATSMSGTSWSQIRRKLTHQYEVECVVSSHDPNYPNMSFDTNIAEVLLVARKVQNGQGKSNRGRFINLSRRPSSETEALALTSAIRQSLQMPVLSVDQPPVGGTPLMLGNDKWGEVVEAPLGHSPWIGSRWGDASCAQYAYSLFKGIVWDASAQLNVARLPIKELSIIADISPHHRQIKGGGGVFEAYQGWDSRVQHPALWHHSAKIHQGMVAKPNASLYPKPGKDHVQIWKNAGTIHVTHAVRYTSQRTAAAITYEPVLGVNTWFTLNLVQKDEETTLRYQIALVLWFNSTLGLLCHASHASRSQLGRGIGNRTMLRTLPTLDVRELADWQLEAAEKLFSDLIDVQFEPFYKCAVDVNRIRLDERLVREVLGLDDDAIHSVAHIRSLLANEPSIYGNKGPELP